MSTRRARFLTNAPCRAIRGSAQPADFFDASRAPRSYPSAPTEGSNVPGMNSSPAAFHSEKDLPQGFFEFLAPLHRQFTPRQHQLAAKRKEVVARAHGVPLPRYLPPSPDPLPPCPVALPVDSQRHANHIRVP